MDIGTNSERGTYNAVDTLKRISDSENIDEVFVDKETEQKP